MGAAEDGDFEFERRFYVRELPDVVRLEPDPSLIVQAYFLAQDGYALRVRVQAPAPAGVSLAEGGDTEVQDRLLQDRVLPDAVAEGTAMSFLTAKGPYVGGTRYEAERELEASVGLEMVRRGPRRVAKLRHSVWLGTDGWVIDEFLGRNAPLIVAECERGTPVVDLTIPEFCHTEISDDARFSNDSLAGSPYGDWHEEFTAELAATGPRFSTAFGRNTLDA